MVTTELIKHQYCILKFPVYTIYDDVLIIIRVHFSSTHTIVLRWSYMHDKNNCRQTDKCHGNSRNNSMSIVSLRRVIQDISTVVHSIKVPITPQNVFRFVKSLYGITKNIAEIFAIG